MSYENQDQTEHELHDFHPNCELCAEPKNMLNTMLSELKGKKLSPFTPNIHPVGKYARSYINKDNPYPGANGKTAKSGAMPIVARLPKYVLLMSRIETATELLKELEIALSGNNTEERT